MNIGGRFMILLKDAAVTSELSVAAETQALEETALASDPSERHIDHERWRDVINEPLIDWGKDPGQLDDGIIRPPSREIVTLASEYGMMVLRENRVPAPDNVVPDGDGGIAFNWYSDNDLTTIEFGEDGTIELIVFEKSKIIHRQRISYPSR